MNVPSIQKKRCFVLTTGLDSSVIKLEFGPRTWSFNIPAKSGSLQEAQVHHFHYLRSQRRDRGRFSLSRLPPVLCSYTYRTCLHDIECDASNSSKSAIFERLSGSPFHRPAAVTHEQQQTRRQARCREYATTQRHWRSNRMRCIKNILEDVEHAKQSPRAAIEPYWTTLFTQPVTVTMPECTQHPVQDSIASPIKAEEIRAASRFTRAR